MPVGQRIAYFWIFLVCQLLLPQKCYCQDRSVEQQVVDSINSGISEWARNVQFVTRFEYQERFGYSIEQIRKKEYLPKSAKNFQEWDRTGTLAKYGDVIALHSNLKQPAVVDKKSRSVGNHSFSRVFSPELCLIYRPSQDPHEHFARSSLVMSHSLLSSELGLDARGQSSTYRFGMWDPFSCGCNYGMPVINIGWRSGSKPKNADVELVSQSRDRVQIQVTNKHRAGLVRKINYVFCTKYRFPFLERYQWILEKDGSYDREFTQTFSNFVDCGDGCWMATALETIHGPLTASNGEPRHFRHLTCKFTDLAKRAPNRKDLEIVCDSDTAFDFFVNPPKSPTPGETITVNILDLNVSDLFVPENQSANNTASTVLDLVADSRNLTESATYPLGKFMIKQWLAWVLLVTGGVMISIWIRFRRKGKAC